MDVKAIFYDLGNVLVSINGKKSFGLLRERCALSREEIMTCFREAQFEQYELGRLSTRDFFDRLKQALVFDGTIETLCEICSDIFVPIQRNIALAYATSQQYPIAILSNTNQAHIDFIRTRYQILSIFKVCIYSYEKGLRKPDAKIYELAARALNVSPEQALLIDDLAENVNAARDLNWNVIQYTPELDLEEAMRSYGILTT
jgi:FMN phosphatase YigB (HAD superfamily)